MSQKKSSGAEKIIVFVVVSVLVGWIAGFALGSSLQKDSDNKETETQETVKMDEKLSGQPGVEVVAHKDSMGGYNLQIKTENFMFMPENAGGEDVKGQGHAHIYVDGKKVGRAYGEWFYVDALEMGDHEIKVSLNKNSHEAYKAGDKEVSATIKVTEDGHTDHTHSEEVKEEDSHDHSSGEAHSH